MIKFCVSGSGEAPALPDLTAGSVWCVVSFLLVGCQCVPIRATHAHPSAW